jgi:hypothetical protein
MKVYSWICLLIGFLFLIGMVSADPFILTNSSSKEWLVANSVDQATITVNVKNTTSGGIIPGAIVTFNIVDPAYGSFSTNPVTTDSGGNAVGTFKVKTKSGTATITASAEYTDTSTTPPTIFTSTTPLTTFEQKIDHDSPYNAVFTYPFNGTVKTTVPFAATLLDRWGNIIDNRKADEIHTVSFHVHGPGSDDCVFLNGSLYSHDISKTLDASGHTSLMVNLTSKPGTNTIMMDRVGSMGDKYKTIEAIANGIPFTIVAVYSPLQGSPLEPRVAASSDLTKKFTIYYTLYDEFGNPTQDQQVWINTTWNDGNPENQTLRTTEWNGQIWTDYGPKNIASDWYITATAVNKNTVTTTQVLHFVNANPTNLQLSASPQIMPSLDANPGMYSNISAKVVDDFGNPVGGQPVTFVISSLQYDCSGNSCVDATANGNGNPSFSNSGSVTTISTTTSTAASDFGIATVKVYPGSFNVTGDYGYKATATGNATVTATWNSVSRDTPIVWKNYPYLSAVTKISPSTVQVGDTIDVNLKLNGDGWALASKPIDVVMVTDRSGSMLYGNPDRMVDAMNAGIVFNSLMDDSKDRVGLVSYGRLDYSPVNGWADLYEGSSHPYSYGTNWPGDDSISTDDNTYIATHYPGSPKYYGTSDMASLELPLTNNPITNKATVDAKINGMVPAGGTPMREGLYLGVKQIVDTPRAGAVKAVILLADGDFDGGHDPTVGGASFPEIGTGSVIQWAASHDIRIYTIALGTTSNEASLTSYATATKGFYRYAPNGAALAQIYKDIAGDLQEQASVNTKASLNFDKILINNIYDISGTAFDYVGDPIVTAGPIAKPPGSTMIDKYNATNHLIPGPDFTVIGPIIKNQTPEWTATKTLSFSAGNVSLGETWETNFRLRVLKEGSYTLFGPDSCVSFTDPTTGVAGAPFCLDNQSSFTASSVPVVNPLGYQSIFVSTPTRTNGEGELVTNFPVTWTTTYTGTNKVYEEIYYVHDNDPMVLIRSLSWDPPSSPFSHSESADLPMTSLPLGSYRIYVHAHSEDASGEATSPLYEYKTSGKSFIKLE